MKKMNIFWILFVGFIGLFFLAIGSLPFFLYAGILSKSFETEWYKVPSKAERYFEGRSSEKIPLASVGFENTKSRWRTFHIANIEIALPVKHPIYHLIPIVKKIGKGAPILGYNLVNAEGKKMASFFILETFPLSLMLNDQKFMSIPLFRKIVLDKKRTELWRDLFAKNLKVKEFKYKQLIYNLHLLHMRSKFFPNNMANFKFIEERNLGMVKLDALDKDYRQEIIYYYNNGIVHSFLISTLKADREAKAVRTEFMKSVLFKEDTQADSRIIYEEFKTLPFSEQISTTGMLYLFAAWSHDIFNKAFLRELIQFLERGKGNFQILKPLYDYAYSTYGTTLSIKEEKEQAPLIELEHKIKKELENEKDELRSKKLDVDVDNLSPEEKMLYFLQKAKDKDLEKTKEPKKMLIMD